MLPKMPPSIFTDGFRENARSHNGENETCPIGRFLSVNLTILASNLKM